MILAFSAALMLASAVAEPAPAPSAPVSETDDRYGAWEKRFGGYGEVDVPFTVIDGLFATMVGGGAGFILIDRVIVGARGYGLAYTDHDFPSPEGSRSLTLAYGGAEVGAYLVRGPVVESAAHWLVGGGRGCLNANRDDIVCGQSSGLFVSHLEMAVYFKVAKILRIGAGLGYRIVAGSTLEGAGDRQLSGGYGTLKIALGRF